MEPGLKAREPFEDHVGEAVRGVLTDVPFAKVRQAKVHGARRIFVLRRVNRKRRQFPVMVLAFCSDEHSQMLMKLVG